MSSPTGEPPPPDPANTIVQDASGVASPPSGSAVPADPVTPAPKSRGWIGLLVAFVVLALLVGVCGVLFVRVQDAQDRADEAVVLARGQDVLDVRLARLEASLAEMERDGQASAEDVDALQGQVSALRKCVNNALDSFAQATQAGKPVSITKC